jgi:hypothetical protein
MSGERSAGVKGKTRVALLPRNKLVFISMNL